MNIGKRLKQLRLEKGLTMDLFVYDINSKYNIDINKGFVSKWENGVNEPSLKYASCLAQYFDVSLDYLIGLTEVRTPARLLAYASKMRPAEIKKEISAKTNKVGIPVRSISDGPLSSDIDDDLEFEFMNLDD